MQNMIFVGGVHGVGKTHFCKIIQEKYGLRFFSASTLIAQKRNREFNSDKKIEDISRNQDLLLFALKDLDLDNNWFILDGHFCLIDQFGAINRIPMSTFENLQPKGIVVLVDSVTEIKSRLLSRDGKYFDNEFLDQYQEEELRYSKEIAGIMHIPYFVFNHGTIQSIEGFFRDLGVIK